MLRLQNKTSYFCDRRVKNVDRCLYQNTFKSSLSSDSMSTAMNFGAKSFKPRPPDKGAFPLDHFGECKAFKEQFMKCLRENNYDNSRCRLQSKDYLECRMDHQLMAKEPLEKLGFKDLMAPPPSQADKDNKP